MDSISLNPQRGPSLTDVRLDDDAFAQVQRTLDFLRTDERTAKRFHRGVLSPHEVAIAAALAQRPDTEPQPQPQP